MPTSIEPDPLGDHIFALETSHVERRLVSDRLRAVLSPVVLVTVLSFCLRPGAYAGRLDDRSRVTFFGFQSLG